MVHGIQFTDNNGNSMLNKNEFLCLQSIIFALTFAPKIASSFNMATRAIATISILSGGKRK